MKWQHILKGQQILYQQKYLAKECTTLTPNVGRTTDVERPAYDEMNRFDNSNKW